MGTKLRSVQRLGFGLVLSGFFIGYQTGNAASGTSSNLNFTPNLIWAGVFNDVHDWKNNNWSINKLPSWGAGNIQVMQSNSTNGTSPHSDNYLRIRYPAGSANSGSSPPLPLGGAQFYGAMIKATNTPITLSYYIRYPTKFPFVNKQGKLPGLYAGKGNTGTNVPNGTDGWTTRYMWCDWAEASNAHPVGGGELLLFTYGSNKGLYGHPYGTSLGCGNWKFSPDSKWHNLQQTVHLNDPGKANGRLDVCYDGNLVLTQTGITFRTVSTLNTNGILFQSFFGGSGSADATPISTYADFADFALYDYPTTSPPGLCISNT